MHRMMPMGYRKKLSSLLLLSGSSKSPEGFFKASLLFSIVVGAAAGLAVMNLFLPLFIAGFAGVFALSHGMIILAVERRARFVESILPDALQLMAANSRAGYMPSRALILSARKEFGPLSDAIKRSGKDMVTGESVEHALKGIPRFISSDILERTINMIIEGSKSGGHFATLLEENAEDIRRMQMLKKEIRANVVMYIIFIGFAGVVAAPVLYSLSSFLIGTIGSIGSSAAIPESVFSNMNFIQFGGIEISEVFLFWFSVAAIFITTFFGGILIGSISSGSERAGIKYVPIFVLVGFALFFVSTTFIGGLFGAVAP